MKPTDQFKKVIQEYLNEQAKTDDVLAEKIKELTPEEWKQKKEDGTQQPAQKEFEAKVNQRGHTYLIIRSLEEFKALVAPILPKPLLPWN